MQKVNKTIPLSQSGYATLTLPSKGTYDLLLTIPGFLHKRLRNQVINIDTTLRPTLLNGDVDRDNAITQLDTRAVQGKIGQFTNGPEDADGDGRITQNDVTIIIMNLGKVGDN